MPNPKDRTHTWKPKPGDMDNIRFLPSTPTDDAMDAMKYARDAVQGKFRLDPKVFVGGKQFGTIDPASIRIDRKALLKTLGIEPDDEEDVPPMKGSHAPKNFGNTGAASANQVVYVTQADMVAARGADMVNIVEKKLTEMIAKGHAPLHVVFDTGAAQNTVPIPSNMIASAKVKAEEIKKMQEKIQKAAMNIPNLAKALGVPKGAGQPGGSTCKNKEPGGSSGGMKIITPSEYAKLWDEIQGGSVDPAKAQALAREKTLEEKLEAQRKESDAEIEEQLTEIASLKDSVAQHRVEKEEMEQELRDAEEERDELEGERDQIISQAEDLQKALKDALKWKDEWKKTADAREKLMEQLASEKASMQEELDHRKKIIERNDKQIGELRARVERNSSGRKVAEGEIREFHYTNGESVRNVFLDGTWQECPRDGHKVASIRGTKVWVEINGFGKWVRI